MSHEILPTDLRLSIGGHFGTSYRVDYRGGGTLVYWRIDESREEHEETLVPTKAQWKAFWKKIDRLELWKWSPHYENPGVCDGTGWSVEIRRDRQSVKSSGDNNYPATPEEPSFDPEPSKLFNGYLRAVSSLLGGREFS